MRVTGSKQFPNLSFRFAGKRAELPKVGASVHISSLGRKGTVLKVDLSKEEVVVQSGIMKLKLRLTDIRT